MEPLALSSWNGFVVIDHETNKMNMPLDQWNGSDATKALHATIKAFNEQSSKQTDQMLKLTRWITGLTVVMTVGLAIQIYLALQ